MSVSTHSDSRSARPPPSPDLVWLADQRAGDPSLTGTKAANIAVARRGRLPVFDGFVITTLGTSGLEGPDRQRELVSSPLGEAWRQLTNGGQRSLAVRSSSVAEDSTTSSMAGRFVSVLHVSGWDAFIDAVFEVIASAASTEIGDAPMAVLVQPMAEARLGGVLFGIDPLTGDRSKVLVSVVEGLPDQVVSGTATGTQIVLGRHGHLHAATGPVPSALGARHRRQLARLATATRRLFGAPQDVEWLIDPAGNLRLLQSRPITASALPAERSHLLGPGPVAETFPEPLSLLERDLWEPPLEEGIREALRISGAVGRRALADRFVIDVGGRVAVDLEVLGVVNPRRSFIRHLDPRPSARRVRAAFRIGRLRTAMPRIAHDLVSDVDGHLAVVPQASRLGDLQLLTVVRNAQQTLAALHAHEVLAGLFLEQRQTTTGASVALAAVARGRADGMSDPEIIAVSPVALALLPPRIGGGRSLPPVPETARMPTGDDDDPMALAREALRLRVRWVHELTVVAVEALGGRLELRGQLRMASDVRDITLAELVELVASPGTAGPPGMHHADPPPLPAQFRLATDGSIVADVTATGAGPIGASSGRVQAAVTHDVREAAGKVLVVRTLDPAIAGVLPVASGLIAETGSPLSHLAILAREYRVPVVVGVAAATDLYHDGDVVVVDGSAGTVDVITVARPREAVRPGPSGEAVDPEVRR